MKTKMRNPMFGSEIPFGNDNLLQFQLNFWNFGLGFNYETGDSRRFLDGYFLFFSVSIWF
jgi:hypothetical protein